MAISVQCQCGQTYRVSEKHAGRKIRCKSCQGILAIPNEHPPEDDWTLGGDATGRDDWGDHFGAHAPSAARPRPARNRRQRGMSTGAKFALGGGIGVVGIVAIVIAVMIIGRKDKEKPSLDVERPKSEPVTRQEAEELARKLDNAIQQNNAGEFDRLVDTNAILDLAATDLELPAGAMAGMRAGLQQSSIFKQARSIIGSGGSYTFLRVREIEGGFRVLFRVLLPNQQGINYHEYMISKQSGKLAFTDLYIYMTGEPMSKTLRRNLLQLATQSNRGLLNRLSQQDRDVARNAESIVNIMQALKQRQSRQALNLITGLPQSMRTMKIVMILRLVAASHLQDEREYSQAFEEYRRLFPGDPSLDLVSIDYYALRKEKAKLLEAIDRLDKSLGGDDHLKQMRQGIQTQQF